MFFDGDDPDRSRNPRGVRVHYSAPLAGDDAILSKVQSSRTPSEIIVVTNDTGLRNRSRDAGARTMTWREFTSKIRYRRDPGRGNEKVDVDEWAKYFGLEEDLDQGSHS